MEYLPPSSKCSDRHVHPRLRPPVSLQIKDSKVRLGCEKSHQVSLCVRFLNHKTLQHNRRRVVFINSCDFLVLSEGEHRAV